MSISDDWAVGSATAVHERSPSASVLDMNYFLQSLHNVCFELSAPFPNPMICLGNTVQHDGAIVVSFSDYSSCKIFLDDTTEPIEEILLTNHYGNCETVNQ
jgi:hypothetical protein